MGKRLGSTVREDTVDTFSIDSRYARRDSRNRAFLERIQDAKLEQGKDGSGKDGL